MIIEVCINVYICILQLKNDSGVDESDLRTGAPGQRDSFGQPMQGGDFSYQGQRSDFGMPQQQLKE